MSDDETDETLSRRRRKLRDSYARSMLLRDLTSTPRSLEEIAAQTNIDLAVLKAIREQRYLVPREKHVVKLGNLALAWEYAQDPRDHHRFVQMLRVSPYVFNVIYELIKKHEVFQNKSNNEQHPIREQLAVFLYRMGRCATVKDIARAAGIAEGSLENYTQCCLTAINRCVIIY